MAKTTKLLNSRQVEHRLGVTPMTLLLWRGVGGSLQSPPATPLPTIIEPCGQRHRVKFDTAAVYAWLKENRPEVAELLKGHGKSCPACAADVKRERSASVKQKRAATVQTVQ